MHERVDLRAADARPHRQRRQVQNLRQPLLSRYATVARGALAGAGGGADLSAHPADHAHLLDLLRRQLPDRAPLSRLHLTERRACDRRRR